MHFSSIYQVELHIRIEDALQATISGWEARMYRAARGYTSHFYSIMENACPESESLEIKVPSAKCSNNYLGTKSARACLRPFATTSELLGLSTVLAQVHSLQTALRSSLRLWPLALVHLLRLDSSYPFD